MTKLAEIAIELKEFIGTKFNPYHGRGGRFTSGSGGGGGGAGAGGSQTFVSPSRPGSVMTPKEADHAISSLRRGDQVTVSFQTKPTVKGYVVTTGKGGPNNRSLVDIQSGPKISSIVTVHSGGPGITKVARTRSLERLPDWLSG